MAATQLVTLVAGSQRLDLPSIGPLIDSAEAALPEGTPVQLDLAFTPVSLPLVGSINLAGAAADVINRAAGAGTFTLRGEGIQSWPGGGLIAAVAPDGTTLQLRWLHGQGFAVLLLTFFLGVAVAGLIAYLYVHHWSLFGALGTASPSIGGLSPLGWGILAAALVLGPSLLRGP